MNPVVKGQLSGITGSVDFASTSTGTNLDDVISAIKEVQSQCNQYLVGVSRSVEGFVEEEDDEIKDTEDIGSESSD